MKKPSVSTSTIFRAMADQTRLRLLCLLHRGELCVCDLCGVLKLAQPKASRHLAYLHRAGLVNARQVGKWKYYSLPKRPGGLQRKLLECVGSCLGDGDIFRKDTVRLDKIRNTRTSVAPQRIVTRARRCSCCE